MARVLVMACSATKLATDIPVMAYELYKGVFWAVLHKQYLHWSDLGPLDLRIISAEYGLLHPTTLVSPYERRMTFERAKDLQPAVSVALLPFADASDVFLCCSPVYRAAINVNWHYPPTIPHGGIGQQMRQLKDWLTNDALRRSQ
ncbi:MAG: hypothetical protein H0X24_00280 [Ktedonobacterales bacterium]|nr:hypothetical protein [Ktedonobacterales bacterium]